MTKRWDLFAFTSVVAGAIIRIVWGLVIHPPVDYLYSDMGPHGKGVTGSGPSGGGSRGNVSGGGVGDLSGRGLPVRLVVAAKNAGLYPHQVVESEKIAQLTEGENLVPMVQSEGTNQWYMVKTQKGLVGWVKSVDVRQEKAKK